MSAGFKAPEFYADSVALAYKLPTSDVPLHPEVTSSDPIDLPLLSDGDLNKFTTFAAPKADRRESLDPIHFPAPETIRAITILAGKRSAVDSLSSASRSSGIAVESSSDGLMYSVVAEVPIGGSVVHTVSFPAVTAKYFRVTFKTQQPPSNPMVEARFAPPEKPPTSIALAEVSLHAGARVNRFEEKAAFAPLSDLYPFPTPMFGPQDAIRRADVVNLTKQMRPDGTLDWTRPLGTG
jgi:hypothetical protein